MMKIHNERGIALVISLLTVMVLLILGSIFVIRTVIERNMADIERATTQAFYISEGSAEAALHQLDDLINTQMRNTVNATYPQTIANDAQAYVTQGDGIGLLMKYVKQSGVAQLTLNGAQAEYNKSTTALGNGTYQYKIILTEKSNPLTITTDMWDFPYYYRMEATGVVRGLSRKIVYSGDFTVRVQRDNFAKYALFTDQHRMQDGTLVWFTDKTNFAGPVHTNERFSFAFNPSGTFEETVTQQYTQARFYNNAFPVLMNANSNPPRDVPTFHGGFSRGVSSVTLSTSVAKQDIIDQARAGDSTTGNGIFLANNGTALTGGIYVKGNAAIAMSVDGNNNAVYSITQGTTAKTITVDIPNNQTVVQTQGGGSVTYAGKPDGVDDLGTIIHVEGSVTSLAGTTQQDTEVTVSSNSDVIITNHLRYSDYTPAVGTPGSAGYAPPQAQDTKNLMGIVVWNGNVRVGTSAPNNLDIHSTVMALNGVFAVDSYSNTGVGPRGIATLLGGAITDYYGAFGLYNGTTGSHIAGYGRNFVYDGRMAVGKAPPYFPSLNAFIAFTNDIADKVVFQEGG